MGDKTLSPMQARTERQLISLRTDNTSAGDYWMLTDGVNVTICDQPMGSEYRHRVTIPRGEFNRLVRWYTREQKVRP